MTAQRDILIIGAGFAGLYLLHRLRDAGFDVVALEAAPDVGGTWYHNRYPGLRCDVDSLEYQYSWSDTLRRTWRWSERYAAQPEILAYARFVADQLDLRRDIQFNTRVTHAHWHDAAGHWRITLEAGDPIIARHVVFATGALAVPRMPEIPGLAQFAGRAIHAAQWPADPVDMAGQRVGIIGTGSSGVQITTAIAPEVGHLAVFQRSPAYSLPARNRPLTDADYSAFLDTLEAFDTMAMRHRGAIVIEPPTQSVLDLDPMAVEQVLAARFERGGAFAFTSSFTDIQTNEAANAQVVAFLHKQIRSIVKDPVTAQALCPTYLYGTRRTCVDTGYYETFNRENVSLVDVASDPITEITATGVRLASGIEHRLDILILATGYDAMTGAFLAVEVTGRDGVTNTQAWADGPVNLLGLMISGFPNLFTITGPGSPSVLTNVIRSIEHHVEWLCRCFEDLRRNAVDRIEPTPEAQADWVAHVNAVASKTLFTKTPSWYCGADIPGKPKVFMPYAGGLPAYRAHADAMAANGYEGFKLGRTGERQ